MNLRVGIGYDVHAFADDRPLYLGGVRIDFSRGLAGHSDADVLIHAIIDALLGAAGLGNIGRLFPDSSPEFRNISSLDLLKRVSDLLVSHGVRIVNIDTVVVCEAPRIGPYEDRMKEALVAALAGLPADSINIKGKTTERLGFEGRGEGISAHAVALLCLPAGASPAE
jgi:2-C-methyl-D-erythritol 2,4-cyclodiphosphate synthase